jgi:hypothetical protein
MKSPLRSALRAANWTFARKPRFVIIGTPRSATAYFSNLCRANGVIVSHEGYFTEHGPMLRNPNRRFDTIGDVSWLAPPFLPDPEVVAVHQVRHPLKVIRSIYEVGLFDPARRYTREAFVALATTYFTPSEDPLHSTLRFWIEWNERCEKITSQRFRIEDLNEQRKQIGEWLGISLNDVASTSQTVNRRSAEVTDGWSVERLRSFPEYSDLVALSNRFGYDLEDPSVSDNNDAIAA